MKANKSRSGLEPHDSPANSTTQCLVTCNTYRRFLSITQSLSILMWQEQKLLRLHTEQRHTKHRRLYVIPSVRTNLTCVRNIYSNIASLTLNKTFANKPSEGMRAHPYLHTYMYICLCGLSVEHVNSG